MPCFSISMTRIFKRVQKISMEVEKRLMDMRCVLVGEAGN